MNLNGLRHFLLKENTHANGVARRAWATLVGSETPAGGAHIRGPPRISLTRSDLQNMPTPAGSVDSAYNDLLPLGS